MPTTQPSFLQWTPTEWGAFFAVAGTFCGAVTAGFLKIIRALRDLKTQHAATQADVAQIKQAVQAVVVAQP